MRGLPRSPGRALRIFFVKNQRQNAKSYVLAKIKKWLAVLVTQFENYRRDSDENLCARRSVIADSLYKISCQSDQRFGNYGPNIVQTHKNSVKIRIKNR